LGGLSSRPWELPSTSARGRSSSTSTTRGVLSSFDHTYVEVKYILPHCRVKEEPRKKEESEKKEAKEIKEVVASVKIKEQKPPVKTKKMTKPENKPAPKMVRKWVPKIATPKER
jgi:hypothetical protein